MSYDDETFHSARLRRFAQRVARERAGTPVSVLKTWSTRTVTERSWFTTREHLVHDDGTQPAPGWIIKLDRMEGYKAYQDRVGICGFEEGRALILEETGALRRASYTIQLRRPLTGGFHERHELTDQRECSDSDLLQFDRLNRADYHRVRPPFNEEWRFALDGRQWRVTVPHPGMEASLALKSFLERGYFIAQLEIQA